MKKALVYLVAFDAPGEIYYRCLAKMAVSSLFASGWQGKVLLISNGKHAVFERRHPRLREESISTDGKRQGEIAEYARIMKIRAAEFISAKKHSYIIYADADILFNPSFCDILPGRPGLCVSREHWILLNSPDTSGPRRLSSSKKPTTSADAGFWIVDSTAYPILMSKWRDVYQSRPLNSASQNHDWQTWNRLLMSIRIPVYNIYPHRVLYPLGGDAGVAYTNDAAVLHFSSVPRHVKFNSMFGKFMEGQTAERAALLINALEP